MTSVYVCVYVCVRNPFNNLSQTDPDLTPSGSTKPLNPLISTQYPQIIYTHTHTPTFLHHFEGPLGKLSAFSCFPFPILATSIQYITPR